MNILMCGVIESSPPEATVNQLTKKNLEPTAFCLGLKCQEFLINGTVRTVRCIMIQILPIQWPTKIQTNIIESLPDKFHPWKTHQIEDCPTVFMAPL